MKSRATKFSQPHYLQAKAQIISIKVYGSAEGSCIQIRQQNPQHPGHLQISSILGTLMGLSLKIGISMEIAEYSTFNSKSNMGCDDVLNLNHALE